MSRKFGWIYQLYKPSRAVIVIQGSSLYCHCTNQSRDVPSLVRNQGQSCTLLGWKGSPAPSSLNEADELKLGWISQLSCKCTSYHKHIVQY